jgi:hypothetical protein
MTDEPKDLLAVRNSRNNMVLVGLVTALAAPKYEKITGQKLTPEEVGELMGAALILWHVLLSGLEKAVALFQLYFPPPRPSGLATNPTSPVEPGKVQT